MLDGLLWRQLHSGTHGVLRQRWQSAPLLRVAVLAANASAAARLACRQYRQYMPSQLVAVNRASVYSMLWWMLAGLAMNTSAAAAAMRSSRSTRWLSLHTQADRRAAAPQAGARKRSRCCWVRSTPWLRSRAAATQQAGREPGAQQRTLPAVQLTAGRGCC